MRLTHNRNVKLYPYKLDGRLLESTKNHPYLGVCITDNLSWTAHINNITSSAYRSLGFIRRNLSVVQYFLQIQIGESWGMANTFLLGLINATYMHDLKSLVYNHKEQVKYY